MLFIKFLVPLVLLASSTVANPIPPPKVYAVDSSSSTPSGQDSSPSSRSIGDAVAMKRDHYSRSDVVTSENGICLFGTNCNAWKAVWDSIEGLSIVKTKKIPEASVADVGSDTKVFAPQKPKRARRSHP